MHICALIWSEETKARFDIDLVRQKIRDILEPQILLLHWSMQPCIGKPDGSSFSYSLRYMPCIVKRQNKDLYIRATYVGSFEVSVLAHVALRMLATIFLASQ